MDSIDPPEWDYIRTELDLRPSIKSPEDYLAAVARGRDRAMRLVAPNITAAPCSFAEIKAVHYCLFNEVYRSAGKFREQEILIGRGLASEPDNIPRDLDFVG